MPFRSAEEILKNKLYTAFLDRLHIIPAYQPIIKLENGKISSFEVLARLVDREIENISPAIFIPVIERLGLLDQMTDQLISRACAEVARLEGHFGLAFNVSPEQFTSADLVERLKTSSLDSGLPLRRIQVEITENAILDDTEVVRGNVGLLKEAGISVILDDFGVGYSSLVRLQSVKFDKIKIDASFVGSMETKRDSRKIVSAIIGLGHSLGLSVVAEGIETEHQLKMLQQLGCDYGQGFFISRPVFAEALGGLLRDRGQTVHDPKPLEMSCNRRLAELDSVYSSNKISICFIDTDFRFVSINKSFCREVGISDEETRGRHVGDVFPGNAEFMRAAMNVMKEYNDIRGKSVILSTASGLISVEMRAVRDENLDVIGFNLFCVDRGEEEGHKILSDIARCQRS